MTRPFRPQQHKGFRHQIQGSNQVNGNNATTLKEGERKYERRNKFCRRHWNVETSERFWARLIWRGATRKAGEVVFEFEPAENLDWKI